MSLRNILLLCLLVYPSCTETVLATRVCENGPLHLQVRVDRDVTDFARRAAGLCPVVSGVQPDRLSEVRGGVPVLPLASELAFPAMAEDEFLVVWNGRSSSDSFAYLCQLLHSIAHLAYPRVAPQSAQESLADYYVGRMMAQCARYDLPEKLNRMGLLSADRLQVMQAGRRDGIGPILRISMTPVSKAVVTEEFPVPPTGRLKVSGELRAVRYIGPGVLASWYSKSDEIVLKFLDGTSVGGLVIVDVLKPAAVPFLPACIWEVPVPSKFEKRQLWYCAPTVINPSDPSLDWVYTVSLIDSSGNEVWTQQDVVGTLSRDNIRLTLSAGLLQVEGRTTPDGEIPNAEFDRWSKFKPGSYVVHRFETQQQEAKSEEMEMTSRLLYSGQDEVVVETLGKLNIAGSVSEIPPRARTIPITIRPESESHSVQPTVGTEEVLVAGRLLRCITLQWTSRVGETNTTSKAWYSDEVPGGMVMQDVYSQGLFGSRTLVVATKWEAR